MIREVFTDSGNLHNRYKEIQIVCSKTTVNGITFHFMNSSDRKSRCPTGKVLHGLGKNYTIAKSTYNIIELFNKNTFI